MRSSKFTSCLLSLPLIALSACSILQGPSFVSDLKFKDPNFAACVQQNGQLELANITELVCNDQDIHSVDEIRYMPALTDLVLLKNGISTIDVSDQPNLERLILGDNQLTTIDVSTNPQLRTLNVSGNKLTQLDISKNPQLKSLYAYRMPIQHLDVSNQPQLRDLGLSRHKLSTIDVTNNPALRQLNLSVGQLTQLDLTSNPILSHLYLASNQLSELDISANPALKVFNVRNNQLSRLLLSNNPQLTELKADYNQLINLDVSQNTALTSLELNNNRLTGLDLSNQVQLEKLTAFNNPLQSLTLHDNNEIKMLSVEGTPFALATQSQSQEQSISQTLSPRVSIIEAGLISQKGSQYDVFPTQLVTPSIGQYIGFRYGVSLPKGSAGKPDPKLANQNQFPITVRMTHPEIINPNTGKGFKVSSWTDTMFKHDRNLAMWYFGEAYEMVTGRWTLEVIYRDSVVAKKSFMLVNMDEEPELSSKQAQAIQQGLTLAKLVKQGETIICAQEKYRACLGFDSANSCEVNISPFREQCQQSAFKALQRAELTSDISATEHLRKYFSHYTACMGANYIQTSALNPKEVGSCLSL
ncbi:leucine-rich repeat domain-containing protein [Shewanella sp. UCD-KL12]|uniref:leucine-rich repeat domain-containing protein n=1 Tax=Shewanella sp. UCD-KL12 TaxID=1917163 RepID=UPI000970478E|nr:DUF3859 domain-containing protein [Shewanella sp. UCD-KL12]